MTDYDTRRRGTSPMETTPDHQEPVITEGQHVRVSAHQVLPQDLTMDQLSQLLMILPCAPTANRGKLWCTYFEDDRVPDSEQGYI
ncbi:hypothetical protein QYF36_010961 [Acer negundo]|nr:hypothetical protein QYF36_010961 [Acer negundo]